MKQGTITIFILLFSIYSNAQNGENAVNRDSLTEARLKMIEENRLARTYFEINYQNNPQAAIDSANRAEELRRRPQGIKRLTEYQSNTRIDTLKEINLTAAGLTRIPDFVFEAKALELLLLDHNSIKRLPKELANLTNLKRVYWRANNLEQFFWIRIPKIAGLEKLDISNNLLTRLPSGVKRLDGLKELVLDENFFPEIPIKRLGKADFVETLSLNKSHQIQIGEGKYESLSFLKTLKINHSNIAEIHPDFYGLKGLNELQLQENQLVSFPAGISNMKSLTKLSFYKNKLKELPLDLFDLKLKVIDLYYNELEVIPTEICNLKELEILYMAHNRIYELPESLGALTNLDEIYLHHNRLSVLPSSLSELTKVRVARVNDNYLAEFPSQFLGMAYLEEFDVSNNQITEIPQELDDLSSLKLFNYQENPIDFNAPDNRGLSPMIFQMIDRGVICVPRVYKEEVREEEQVN
ncbi:MAG: hypothetical protein JXR10_16865 [Cyclobacteriaceae bacterium]